MNWQDTLKITGLPVIVASLCCFSSVVLVLFGLSSVSFAASLAGTLYGIYRWIFRGVGLFLLLLSLIFYFRQKGICTLDEAKKKRTMIINTIILSVIVAVLGYLFFLYVVVEYLGMLFGIWE